LTAARSPSGERAHQREGRSRRWPSSSLPAAMAALFSGCSLYDSGERGLEDRKEERMGTRGLGPTGFVLTVSGRTPATPLHRGHGWPDSGSCMLWGIGKKWRAKRERRKGGACCGRMPGGAGHRWPSPATGMTKPAAGQACVREARGRRKVKWSRVSKGASRNRGGCIYETHCRPSDPDLRKWMALHGRVPTCRKTAQLGGDGRPKWRPARRLLGLGPRPTHEDKPRAVFSRGSKRKGFAQYVFVNCFNVFRSIYV
jgi:hypothetical protein